jgi:hypothetical protein
MLPDRQPPEWHPALLRLALLAQSRLLFGWHARQLAAVTTADLLSRVQAALLMLEVPR